MVQTFNIPAERYEQAYQPATSVQSWKKHKTITTSYENRTVAPATDLSHGTNPIDSMMNEANGVKSNFEVALAEAGGKTKSSEFSFDDFIDIINPLHHLPVVGMIYRSLTGDTINPVASIVGGGLFGGPMGAIGGIANAVVQHETGKDIAGNVFALVTSGDGSGTANPSSIASGFKDDPETQLALAASSHGLDGREETKNNHSAPPPPFAENDFPAAALSFADLQAGTRAYQKIAIAEGRTAGWHIEQVQNEPAAPLTHQPFNARALVDRALPPREAITTLSLERLPAIY